MASRAIWEGTISFGLVQIPVGLHSAESRDHLEFTQLDRRDLAPVGYRRYNHKTDKEVEWADIVKGYEYSDGKYVVLEKEDLKRANPKSTQTVEIVHFTDADQIEPVYYEKPYYLVPGKRGGKAYVLLREVLKKTGKVGLARVVIRTREHVAALIVRGPALVLMLLRYAHELVAPSDLEIPGGTIKSANLSRGEVAMAERLVRDMESDFEPRKYKDTYHDDLLAFIKKKVKAGDTADIEEDEEEAEEPEPSNVVDIMSLLRRSLGKKDEPAAKTAKKKTAKQASKTATKKTAAKKTAAKKTATKKTATKKTAVKKIGKKAAHKKKAARHSTRKAA